MSKRRQRERLSKQIAEAKRETAVTTYAVLFLDLLGQRDQIRRMEQVQLDAHYESGIINALKNSYGKVHGVVNNVNGYLEGYLKGPRGPLRDNLSPLDQQAMRIWQSHRAAPRIQTFSDTVLIYARVGGYGQVFMHEVEALLTAAGATMLVSFAGKAPLRGGFSLGLGLETFEGGFYGPALLGAYESECTAGHPRIVINPNMIDFLNHMASSPPGGLGTFAAASSKLCQQLIRRDDDGRSSVDYLGRVFREWIFNERRGELFETAFSFVKAEAVRHASDAKLAPRYAVLQRYFEMNAADWRA